MEASTHHMDVTMSDRGDCSLTHEDWAQLNQGDRILVQRAGNAPQQGTVDDVSEDASYFWAWLDGHGRVLIYNGDQSVISRLGQ
jgi:hypothetical protein